MMVLCSFPDHDHEPWQCPGSPGSPVLDRRLPEYRYDEGFARCRSCARTDYLHDGDCPVPTQEVM